MRRRGPLAGGYLIACEGGARLREDALSLAKEGPACEGGTHLWEDTLSLVVRGTPLAKKSKKEKETKNESSI